MTTVSLLLILAASAHPGAETTELRGWTESPQHVRLFAPPAHLSAYRAYVTTRPLDDVLTDIRAQLETVAPGAWMVEKLAPLDAFGASGTYNPFQLSRLYVAGPVRVARGPRVSSAGLEAWTLLSPYPDPALGKLDTGTLLIVLRVPPI